MKFINKSKPEHFYFSTKIKKFLTEQALHLIWLRKNDSCFEKSFAFNFAFVRSFPTFSRHLERTLPIQHNRCFSAYIPLPGCRQTIKLPQQHNALSDIWLMTKDKKPSLSPKAKEKMSIRGLIYLCELHVAEACPSEPC